MNIILSYPSWYLILCVLTGIIASGILYFRNRESPDLPLWMQGLLAIFRFAVITTLAILLLEPLLSYLEREEEKPIVVIAQDNSSSILIGRDSTFYKDVYPNHLNDFVRSLSDQYDVRLYTFGQSVEEDKEIDYSAQISDMSGLVQELEDRYTNRNLGAVVFATDGIYNRGSNPLYSFSAINTPIYTVALGDTTIRRDLLIKDVAHNKLAYLGNEFPLEILVDASHLQGESTILTISKDGNEVFRQNITINEDRFQQVIPLTLKAEEVGIQRYSISLSQVEDELSTKNNYRDIFIDVLDSRRRILILADAPHPDLHAINAALYANDNYETELAYAEDFDGNPEDFSLVILHQLPSAKHPIPFVVENITDKNIPALVVLGGQTLTDQLGRLGSGVRFTETRGSLNEVTAAVNQSFSSFTLQEELIALAEKFPPLHVPFGDISLSSGVQVLFYQKAGYLATEDPLVFFNENNSQKTGTILGEGIWRWRLFTYLQTGSHQVFDEMLNKIVQYLAARDDKSFFRVESKTQFAENETIFIEAELYNPSYELINDPEVNLVIRDSEDREFPFAFSRTANAYRVNAGMLPPGEYSFEASVNYNGEVFKKAGAFSVSELALEAANTVADHRLLYQIAYRTGGEMIYPNMLNELAEKIKAHNEIKPIQYSRESLAEVINLKWLFFLLLAFLSFEWFIRKRKGAY